MSKFPFKKGPWTVKTSEVKYKNPWIEVREDQVIRPDGKDGIFGVVTMKAGVSVLPMDKDGNVYLIKEYHYAVETDALEVMSGGINEGEDKEAAAKRELKEETGFMAEKLTYLGVVDPLTTIVNAPDHMFLVEELTLTEKELEGTEVIETVKVPLEKALEMVIDGKITHSASVALILKTARILGK